MNTIACSDANFDAEAVQSDRPVLVDFFAAWCGPCKVMGPVVDALAGELKGRLKVVKVDVAEAPRAAAQFGVTSIPSFVVLDGGKVQAQLTGLRSKQTLLDVVKPYLK